jgi:hypothetical protein
MLATEAEAVTKSLAEPSLARSIFARSSVMTDEWARSQAMTCPIKLAKKF